jgi:hypothetical protein
MAGLACIALGSFMFVGALEIFDLDFEGHRAVMALVATGIALVGLWLVAAAATRGMPWRPGSPGSLAALVFVSLLALGLTWVTLDSGGRIYTRVAGFRLPIPTNVTLERLFVAPFALALDAAVVSGWFETLRALVARMGRS